MVYGKVYDEFGDKAMNADDHWKLSLSYRSQNKYELAIKEYWKIIDKALNNTTKENAYVEIARIYFNKGDHSKALQMYNEFLFKYPKSIYIEEVKKALKWLENYLKSKEKGGN
ncbi:MAG: tetratricopeptide repeat protein [Candidatus Firestonebacteria bacterium]